jgi:hypothetical protein
MATVVARRFFDARWRQKRRKMNFFLFWATKHSLPQPARSTIVARVPPSLV